MGLKNMRNLIPAAAGIGGAVLDYNGAKRGASARNVGIKLGMDQQVKQQEQNRADLDPFRTAGVNAIGAMNDPNAYQQSPGYKFALDQQQKQIEQSAAARGGLFSGNTGKALQQNAIGLANQDYGDWWNRQQGVVNTGLSATQTGVQAGQSGANNLTNLLVAQGENKGAGKEAQAGALADGLGTVAGAAYNYFGGGAAAAGGTAAAGAGAAGAGAAGAGAAGAGAAGTAAAGAGGGAASSGALAAAAPVAALAGMAIAGALIIRDTLKKDPAIAGAKYDAASGQLQLGTPATSRDSPLGYYAGDKNNAGASIASTYGISDEEVWSALAPVLESYKAGTGDRNANIKASLGAIQKPANYEQFRKLSLEAQRSKGAYRNTSAQDLINAGFSKQDIIANYAYMLATDQKNGLATGKNDVFKAIDMAKQAETNRAVIGGQNAAP